jgi:hypothetical protein
VTSIACGSAHGPAFAGARPATCPRAALRLAWRDASSIWRTQRRWETESYLFAQHAVEACAMAVLHGGAGLRKTYAVDDALEAPDIRTVTGT